VTEQQTPRPYGDPAPGDRDAWGPPGAGTDPAGAPAPWWSAPQQTAPAPPSPWSPEGGATAVAAAPPWAATPGGAGWPAPPGADARAERRDRGSPLRTATVVAVVAGLIGGGIGAGVVSLARDNGTGSASRGAVTTLTQVRDPGGNGARPAGSVADIAARVLPSVVTIQESSGSSQGTGSGVVIDKANGYILTNNHVVADAVGGGGTLAVIPDGGRAGASVPATIVGTDAASDLAVVKVARGDLPAITLGKSADVVVGDTVLAVGAPLGLSGTVTSGIISALDRSPEVPDSATGNSKILTGALQTDAAINPGNSGGALVDSQGRLIGINTAIASSGGSGGGQAGNIGIGFAIPIDAAAPIAQELIATGKATHPYVGVGTKDSTNPVGARVTAPASGGAAVRPGSPAAAAGLQEGDVVTRFDGAPVASATDLVSAVRKHRVGDKVAVDLSRDGKQRTVSVTLADNPALK